MENKRILPEGFRVTTQSPIDDRHVFKTIAALIDLGVNDQNAYRYHEGMMTYCIENRSEYVWEESATGALATSFTYPANIVANGITYSGRAFNFSAINEDIVLPEINVFADQNDPNTGGTVFTDIDENVIAGGDPVVLYIGLNSSTWTYNTGTGSYVTFIAPLINNTPWRLYGTSIDAGGNKTGFISRNGSILVNSTNGATYAGFFYSRTTSGVGRGLIVRKDLRTTSGDYLTVQGLNFSTGTLQNRLRVTHDGNLEINGAYTLPNVDGAVNQVLTTDGAGVTTWGTVNTDIPQSNVIYVDSTNGINDITGRGDINKPYLTPEYALANIVNTGNITATTATNTTLSGISDVDNANLVLGQYITGTGIPFGTIITFKGNQGGNANTVTLSKIPTANATITAAWFTIYEVRLSGVFNAVSNWNKEGMWINSQSAIIYFGAITLYGGSTSYKIPHKILGKGNYFGTDISSRWLYMTGAQVLGFTLDVDRGDIETIGTAEAIFTSFTGPMSSYKHRGGFVNARFGKVLYHMGAVADIDFNSYGLLGGLSFSQNNNFSTYVRGRHETPSAVYVLSSGYRTFSRADLYGSTLWDQSSHVGVLSGSNHSLIGGDITATGGGGIVTFVGSSIFRSTFGFTIIVNAAAFANLYCDSGTVIQTNNGTVRNHGAVSAELTGTGITYNYGDMFVNVSNSFNGTLINYSRLRTFSLGNQLAFTVKNYGVHEMTGYALGRGGPWTYLNKGVIETAGNITNNSAMINLSNVGCIFDNYGTLINNNVAVGFSVIDKSRGKLLLRQGSVIEVSNSLSPIRVASVDSGTTTSTTAFKLIQTLQNFTSTVVIGDRVKNTTDNTWAIVTAVDSTTTITLDTDIMVSGETFVIYGNHDIYNFGTTTNCDGTTHGLLMEYDGNELVPNDLVGGVLYENVNY